MKTFRAAKICSVLFISLVSIRSIQSQNIESQIDKLISKTYIENGPGIAILIAKNGIPLYKKSFGKSNIELNSNVNTESVFQIGSLTKQFTATAILMLEEKGKLKLTDNITKYLPEYPTNGNNITVHNLLNHTSGIRGRTPISDPKLMAIDMKAEQLIEYFKKQPLKFNSGEQFSYSNSGYILLGRIIEIITGMSYEDFIENNIFKKLKMNNSRYGNNKEIIKNRASGYQFNGKEYINATYMSLTIQYAAGSILSTVDDLLKWQNALNSNALIKQSNFVKATNGSILKNGKKIPYGYGWYKRKINNSTAITHGGATSGFMSNSIYLKDENIYIIALTNCFCKKNKNLQKITYKIATLFTQKTSEKNIEEIQLPKNKLNKWTGTYRLNNNTYISIKLDNNNLYGYNTKKENIKHKLIPISENDFIFENKKFSFHFMMSKNGEKKVKMSSGNRVLFGIKIN